MQPNSRSELAQYALRKLGKGAIDINVTPEQIDDRIDDALDYFYAFQMDALETKYLAHQVTANDIANTSFTMPANTYGVRRIFPLNGDSVNSNINGNFNIFDLNYQLRLNELYDFTSADYVYFELANEHIATLQMLFIGEIPVRYNRYTNVLYCDMNWSTKVGVNTFIVVESYQLVDDTSGAMWADQSLKLLTTAMVKEQWGSNLKKFKGTPLPGGIVLDGQQMYNEAIVEVEEAKKRIRDWYEMPVEFFVG